MYKINLKDWVILLTIIPTAFIGFGLAGYFSYIRSVELDQSLNLRAQSIIEPLAITSKGALVSNNRAQLRAIISEAHRSQSNLVKSITVFSLDNQMFVTSAYNGSSHLLRLKPGAQIPAYTQGEHVNNAIIFRTPVIEENIGNKDVATPLGYIAVYIDKSAIKLKQQSQYIIAFSIAIFSIFLSSIFALKLMKKVTKPINSMVHAIDRIREGKLESRVSGQLVSELNFLKNGINAMAQSLGNHQNEMQSNIDQATLDLRESLEQYEIQNVELSIAKKKAQETNRIKSEFLANMSHELRTPLNGVIGFTRQVLKTPLNDSQRDYLQTIDRSAHNLLSIINDILDFSKLEAGKMVIESIPFSLRDSLEENLTLLAPSAHKKDIELSINIDHAIPDSLLGDAMRVKQIMNNLVSNAIKFTEYGSVTIDVTYKIINAKRAAIKITVADTGIGMDNEQQQTIFKAFAQADQSITRLYGGTGLGLVISQRLAYEMKGDIGFSSVEGQGSTFWFDFECGFNTLALASEHEHSRLANKSILYYEPHSHSRAATNQTLLNWQMQVTTVESIELLNQLLDQDSSDPVKFDFALIGHDHTSTALSSLKKLIVQVKAKIPEVHIAINSNSPSLHDALIASGALSCLSKPIITKELHTVLLAEPESLSAPTKQILPIKVLAVDDNEANLKLINALLLEQVTDVVLAENGMKALTLCQSEVFSLIFMDIQMPIMDGITTLKAIRNNSYNEQTPIIAVTAHALSGEKEKMQEQGFNAYMTKPIDETMLSHIIYEYCDVSYFLKSKHYAIPEPAAKKLPAIPAISSDTSAIIDWSLALTRANNNQDLAKEMLTGLIAELPANQTNITSALEAQDSVELKRLIHKLNGACSCTGVPGLSAICHELETQLKKEVEVSDLEPEFFEIFEQIALVLTQAPKILSQLT
ncbi:two-component sensor histidine kinase BarA [Colwellia sp. KU-HH00111]|uniref:two-component sensor histidine kinase BarA n=1 Tax=Colwellia sp. KU-HH00111 TaxID=3127652 RepID=UPI00310C64D7